MIIAIATIEDTLSSDGIFCGNWGILQTQRQLYTFYSLTIFTRFLRLILILLGPNIFKLTFLLTMWKCGEGFEIACTVYYYIVR